MKKTDEVESEGAETPAGGANVPRIDVGGLQKCIRKLGRLIVCRDETEALAPKYAEEIVELERTATIEDRAAIDLLSMRRAQVDLIPKKLAELEAQIEVKKDELDKLAASFDGLLAEMWKADNARLVASAAQVLGPWCDDRDARMAEQLAVGLPKIRAFVGYVRHLQAATGEAKAELLIALGDRVNERGTLLSQDLENLIKA